MKQRTIKSTVRIPGTGLHTGKPVRMVLRPAPAGFGIRFFRSDVTDRDPWVPALWSQRVESRLNTTLANGDGVSVGTIEHLMAALAGCGVHNLRIDMDGPEVPILDGSAVRFVRALRKVGLQVQDAPLTVYKIRKTVVVTENGAQGRLVPADRVEIDFRIDFDDGAIGCQALRLDLAGDAFLRHLQDSRTFCRLSDVRAMQAAGLALGGTFENAVVVDGDQILSPGGLRHSDEFVRHKMLDAVGDLALAGAPILGRYTGIRAGHALTGRLLEKLFATPGAVETITADAALAARLPGLTPLSALAADVA
jgi:UDP-3-O-[3-hydroxymyristoyl] N-acetylglucosamine deacetylase